MKRIANIGTFVTLLLCACSSWAQNPDALKICSGEVRDALLAALRLGVGDMALDYPSEGIDGHVSAIPDYAVLPPTGPILVRMYLDEPRCVLDTSILPTSALRTFVLVDDEDLGRRAAQRENGVTYVSASNVRFNDDQVVVWLRTALRLPPGDARGLCCCGGEMVLRRVNGEWRFVEWRNIICA